MKTLSLVCLAVFGALPALSQHQSARQVLDLDGNWDIADSLSATDIPSTYSHKAPVPGLAHSATPGFPDVDLFDSREVIANRIPRGEMPADALDHLATPAGNPHQNRNYFWYRTAFHAPAQRAHAELRIDKAQFGAAVWLNGKKLGEHLPCFSAAIFDASNSIHWSGRNELIVRVGAHPGVLPANVNAGTDFEKNRWTPGIYDDVSVVLSDNPAVETIQVAPRVSPAEIVVQTKLKNYGNHPAQFDLRQRVHPWRETGTVAQASEHLTLAAGEERAVTQAIRLPNAKLWSPEQPNLYMLETATGGDSSSTRFGMREFRFDTATRRAYLNGKPYYMRGSNITLHRFFEDPESGTLPWNEQWTRKLLVDIPKKMGWNSFRFCIGPVPEKWLDIADEAGLLIQNEYFVWIGRPSWHARRYTKTFDADEMIGEYSEWMRDNWNHPSVAIWDANNESWYPDFKAKIIPAVRPLDLSHRPWENSYNAPDGPDDPVEDHPYEFQSQSNNFTMEDLEKRGGGERSTATIPTGHAMILNEYGWLWLNRDGSPTELTKELYPKLLGPNATADQRLDTNAYDLAGISEFWRAYRKYAGILHFVYLTGCDSKGFTCDNFLDPRTLKLNPYFEKYMSNAFQPLGVYVNFFHPKLETHSTQTFEVMMVNDKDEPVSGDLTLALQNAAGKTLARQTKPFSLRDLGAETYVIDFPVPAGSGKAWLTATAKATHGYARAPVISRRHVELVEAGGAAK